MNLIISGFSDEISDELSKQIEVVKELGMDHISLRGIDGTNIGEFTAERFKAEVLPRLQEAGIKVSSIGSPIGKVFVDDEEGYEKQLKVLEEICQIANMLECKYIRIFSFYIKSEENYDDYEEVVIKKIKGYAEIAERYNVVLLHENEKDIFGDIARRCYTIFKEVGSPSFRAIFDFANFVQCKEQTEEAYELLKEYVEYFHIKDASYSVSYNVLAGTGDGKIPEILTKAIKEDGYEGFLTLEPHLAMFGSLQGLELEAAEEVVNTEANITGEEGYKMQYEAITNIIKAIN